LKFNEFNLSAELLAEIEKAGFVEASPIQEQTIPLALEGKDVIGQAQTGHKDSLSSLSFEAND
jgi:ATP-dependent RNA helicase DeaD